MCYNSPMISEQQDPVVSASTQSSETTTHFSRLDGNVKSYLATFFYTLFLSVVVYVLVTYLRSPEIQYNLGGNVTFLNWISYLIRGFLLVPLSIFSILTVMTIYKKRSTIITALVVIFIVFTGYVFLLSMIGEGDRMSFILSFVLYLIFILTASVLLGLGLRAVFKIKSLGFKILLLAIHYVLVLLIFGLSSTRAHSVSANECKQMLDSNKKTRCYGSVAKKTNDLNLCMEMHKNDNPGYYYDRDTDCIPTVISNLEKIGKYNASDCPSFSKGLRNGCYKRNALREKDNVLCGNITDSYSKNECYVELSKAGDEVACRLIDEEINDMHKYAKHNCMTKIALEKNDIKLCESAGVDGPRCYEEFAALRKDIGVCDTYIKDKYDISFLGACYTRVAAAMRDRTICDKIVSSDWKASCYRDVR